MTEAQVAELMAWIAGEGLAGRSETDVIGGFCERLGAHGVPLTRAIGEGLDLWLAREKRRKATKGDPLARYLNPPSAREIAARRGTKDDAARADAGSHPTPLPPDAPVLGGKR